MLLLWIGVGGAIGSVVRALLTSQLNAAFPYGTLSVNIIGSLAIGVLLATSATAVISEAVRLPLIVGTLGGFTTMSAFSFESVELLRGGSPLHGIAYITLTLLLCLGAVALGLVLAERLFPQVAPH